jgi:hypothetical protein
MIRDITLVCINNEDTSSIQGYQQKNKNNASIVFITNFIIQIYLAIIYYEKNINKEEAMKISIICLV